ncbi:MAG: hypothetical protein H6561_13575 [Lewinellaceae bacterium]|nr:hypothetical protein [Lewinellaceae bacterium]
MYGQAGFSGSVIHRASLNRLAGAPSEMDSMMRVPEIPYPEAQPAAAFENAGDAAWEVDYPSGWV